MNKSKQSPKLISTVILFISFILSFPLESYADAVNPLYNLFTPDTFVSASIFTVLIILIEAWLLKKWLKPVPFRVSLWRTAAINFISSAAGSIAVWSFFRDQLTWGRISFFIPMFFLTLATETPTLKFLYRREGINWKRIISVSFGINLISYIFVFIAQWGLIFGLLGFSGFADKQTIKNWNDISVLKGESGYIYTLAYSPSKEFTKHIFKRYSVENNTWEMIDPGFKQGVLPEVWDIKGNLIACIIETGDWRNRPINVLTADTFSRKLEINGNFRDVRISPDLSKLAILEYVIELKAPRNNESDYNLGTACKLKIYDIQTSNLLLESPRQALDLGLTWTNNSQSIIFSSFRDELLMQARDDLNHSSSYGRHYAKLGQFPIDLFIYNLSKDSIETLTEGQVPRSISSKNEITFLRESGFYNRDLWRMNIEQEKPHLVLSNVRGYAHAVSPSGEKYLVLYPHKQPFSSGSFLTMVDPEGLTNKFIIDPNSYFDFRWIPNNR